MKEAVWYAQVNSDDNLLAIVKNLAYRANIKISSVGLKRLLEHPTYPSLRALADLLTWCKVRNKAVRVGPQKLDSLEFPAVAHMGGEEQRFVLLVNSNADSVTYLDSLRGEITVPKESFFQEWTGIVHLIEPVSDAGEPNYRINRLIGFFGGRNGIGVTSLLLLALIAPVINLFRVDIGFGVIGGLLWMASILLGLYASFASLLKEKRIDLPLFNAFCPIDRHVGERGSGCQAVIQSGKTGILGKFSLSELGVTYFLFLLLMLYLIPLWNSGTQLLLTTLSLLAMPCVVLALWYQWRVIKHWCVVCLLVHGALFFQALFWAYLTPSLAIAKPGMASMIGASLTVVAVSVWLVSRNHLSKGFHYSRLRASYDRVRRLPAVLKQLAASGRPMSIQCRSDELILGNRNSPHTLVLGVSPFCAHCAEAVRVVNKQLLPTGRIRVVLRFLISESATESYLCSVRRLLGALMYRNESEVELDVLERWYSDATSEGVTLRSLDPATIQHIDQLITSYQEWTRKKGLRGSPFLWLNGYQLSDVIEFSDLPYLIKII